MENVNGDYNSLDVIWIQSLMSFRKNRRGHSDDNASRMKCVRYLTIFCDPEDPLLIILFCGKTVRFRSKHHSNWYYYLTSTSTTSHVPLCFLLPMAAQINVPLELIQYKLTLEDIVLFMEHKQEWQDADWKKWQVITSKVYVQWKAGNTHWNNDEKKLKKEVWSLLHKYWLLLNTSWY